MATCDTATISSVADGTFMLPEPRITDEKVLTSQMKMDPRKATLA